MAITVQMRTQVSQLYVALFGRAPDGDGLAFWVGRLDTLGGTSAAMTQIANDMFATTPARTYFPLFLTNREIISSFYLNVLGRTADTTGLDFWTAKLDARGATPGSVITEMISAVVNFPSTGTADGVTSRDLFNNKVTVAQAYGEKNLGVANATSILSGVTSSAATVTSALNLINTNNGAPIGTGGQTFTLTTNSDQVPGTAGDDVINGAVDYGGAQTVATGSTFTLADNIDGAAGNDTLNVIFSNAAGGGVNAPAATVTNVETVNLRNVSGQTLTADASLFSGVTTINADRATAATTLTNVGKTTAVGMIGNGSSTNGALTATFVAGTTAATLNASSGTTAGAVTLNGNADAKLTALTINSTGASNTLGGIAAPAAVKTVTINAATSLTTGGITNVAASTSVTVAGAAASVNLGTLALNVTTVNAAGLTAGGITTTLNTLTATVTGGAGNDSITTAGVLTGSVDAGAGTDRLVVATATDITAASGALYKNFEILRNADTAATVNASLVSGITSVELSGTGTASGFTGLNATQAGAVTALATGDAATLALTDATGTSDVLGLTLASATATTVVNQTALKINGFETLNLVSGSGLASATVKTDGTAATAGTDFNQATFNTATSLKAINVSGAYGIDVNINGVAAKVAKVDASANTAGATIEVGGQTVASVITGTAANDVITISAAAGAGGSYSISGGAGNDTIVGAASDIAAATVDGGIGTDTLKLADTGALTLADNTFQNVSGIEKLVFGTTTGALSWTVGGYANALATGNSGVLAADIKSVTTGSVTFDGSGLSGSNGLKLAVTETAGAAATGAISIISSKGGADSITVAITNSGAGNATGAITVDASANTAGVTIDGSGITGGGGGGTGAIALKGSKGIDTIKGGSLAATITPGKGADVVTLKAAHATVQTLVIADGDSTTSAYDAITNFVAAQDVLDFTANAALLADGGYNATQTGVANLTATVGTGKITFGGTAATGLALADALTAAQNLVAAGATAGTTVGFNLGTNAYVVEYNVTAPVVVQLVGTAINTLVVNVGNNITTT